MGSGHTEAYLYAMVDRLLAHKEGLKKTFFGPFHHLVATFHVHTVKLLLRTSGAVGYWYMGSPVYGVGANVINISF